MSRRVCALLALAVVSALVLALVGCSGGGGNPYGSSGNATNATPSGGGTNNTAGGGAGGVTVTMQNIAFDKTSVTMKVGETLTFTNADNAPHDIKVGDQDLGTQQPGESKTWKATKAGTFPFKCLIHPSMTGQVTVQ